MSSLRTFLDKLKSGKKILMDGAMGTTLIERGVDTSEKLYSAKVLLDNPDLVKQIHRDYIEAGSEVILTNTFCTSTRALTTASLQQHKDELPDLAVDLALQAVEESGRGDDVLVAGSISPLGTFFPSEPTPEQLFKAQEAHALRLAMAGVDVVFCETLTSVKESVAAVKAVKSAGLEVVASFVPIDTRHLMSGETLDTAIRAVLPFKPIAMGLNCCQSRVMESALPTLLSFTSLPVAASGSMPTAKPPVDLKKFREVSSLQYLLHAQHWYEMGARLLGGCCGTGPEHIRKLKEKLNFDPIETV